MKAKQAWYVERRGELLAEQFLIDLGADYVSSRRSTDPGLDYVAFFKKNGGMPRVIGVQLERTQREVTGRYRMSAGQIRRLQGSDLPILMIVADVKHNEIHYAWMREEVLPERMDSSRGASITLRKWMPGEKSKLRHEILAQSTPPHFVA
jgi:hypothetical protein